MFRFPFPVGDLRYMVHGPNGYVVVLAGWGFADPMRIIRLVEPLYVDHQKRFTRVVRADMYVGSDPYAEHCSVPDR